MYKAVGLLAWNAVRPFRR